jgi:pimeloyl-ACP methyl ester carboxylesterase
MRRRRFWAIASLSVLGIAMGTLYVVGQVLQRSMTDAEIDRFPRYQTSFDVPGQGPVTVSYVCSDTPPGRGGTPLVYIHGTPGDASNFVAYLRHPVAGHPSVALDRPGFGASRHDRAFVSFAEQARAVIAVLDAMRVERAILVGHSLGGPIAARVAADFPDRVAGIVEAAGSLDPDLEELKWYNQLLRWWPLTWILPRSFIHSNEEVLAAREQCELLRPRLAAVHCPVMIVHGTEDRLVPYANTAYMEREFTGASRIELRSLPGADHFLPWAQESQLRSAIGTMIQWVDGGNVGVSAD